MIYYKLSWKIIILFYLLIKLLFYQAYIYFSKNSFQLTFFTEYEKYKIIQNNILFMQILFL